jgi:hypothetical protein
MSFGFEDHSIDVGLERWWVVGDLRPLEQILIAECNRPWGVLRVDLRGRLSQPGEYGHLGVFRRELEVLDVNSASFVECQRPPDRPER